MVLMILSFGCSNNKSPNTNDIYTYRKAAYNLPKTRKELALTSMQTKSRVSILNLMFDGLFRRSPNLTPEPQMVKKWSLSNDGLTYDFLIHDGIFFHNGDKLYAKDIVLHFSKILSRKKNISNFSNIVSHISLKSKYKFTIKLKEKNSKFTFMLSTISTKIFKTVDGEEVGTGMYKFKKVSKEGDNLIIKLERNENYYFKKPFFKFFEFWEVPSHKLMHLADKGVIHDTSAYPLTFYYNYKNLNSIEVTGSETILLAINSNKVGLNNKLVRNYIRDSIYNSDIIKKYMKGHQKAKGYIPPGILGYRPNISSNNAIKNHISTKQLKELKTIVLDYPTELYKGAELCKAISNYIKPINIKCRGISVEKISKNFIKKDFDIAYLLMSLNNPDEVSFVKVFHSKISFNIANAKDNFLNKLIIQASQEKDRVKRKTIMTSINTHLYKNSYTVNLSYPKRIAYINKCIEGFEYGYSGDPNIDYSNIKISNKCKNLNFFRGNNSAYNK